MTLYSTLQALAVGFLWLVGGSLALLLWAHVWAWMQKRDASEFWQPRDADPQEIYLHAPQHNRVTESALPQIRGDYDDATPFALDADPRPEGAA